MTTKDKTVPFIKASELIKKEKRDFYIVNNNDKNNKYQVINQDFTDLKEACDKKVRWFYENKFGLVATALDNDRVEKLAKRLEREFLRNEKKKRSFDKAYYHVNCLFAHAGISTERYTTEQIGEITAIILEKIKNKEFYNLIDFKPLEK